MFARIKKSGKNQYLQIVENRREGKKIFQRVIATIGRMDQLQARGDIETLIRSLSRFSEKALLVLSGKGDVNAAAQKIGPTLIFERLWEELHIGKAIQSALTDRKFEFDVERSIFLTVLHRLFASGSDRSCEQWRRDYQIAGIADLSLHHLYRAMAFLGEEIPDQEGSTPFAPRCVKDLVEENIFAANRTLFTDVDLVFFDTTSLHFAGEGGETLGKKGHSKNHRPDSNQIVVGALVSDEGRPVCSEIWPGNTADVKSLIPVADRFRKRFDVGSFCLVADRGMISNETMRELEERQIPYILGTRMRSMAEVREDVLSWPGRYREVHPEGVSTKDPSPLKVKEVNLPPHRYIVCFNPRQARKDAQDRRLIIDSLEEKLRKDPKALIGNKGYRKYLKVDRENISINQKKIEEEERFDGKWVIKTNTAFSPEKVALKYKELWQVEHIFRDMKSVLETRPVFHQLDETIRGHVFSSFLALVLRKELQKRLEEHGCCFEWSAIKQDLNALQEVTLEERGKSLAVRTECLGTCGKIFQAVGVAVPPAIREI